MGCLGSGGKRSTREARLQNGRPAAGHPIQRRADLQPQSSHPDVSGRSKGANAPTGSEAEPLPPAVVEFLGRPGGRGRRSDCEPYRDLILAKLEQGLSARRIYQDLVSERSFTGRYWSVRRFVQKLSGGRQLAMRRMEVGPGEEAQVDFGSGAPIITPDGRRRKTHVFRIVLSHSRKAYSEATFTQTAEDFIRCLENAFAHFGGVPQTLVIDNLRAAVAPLRLGWHARRATARSGRPPAQSRRVPGTDPPG
jgi:Integrase core domain